MVKDVITVLSNARFAELGSMQGDWLCEYSADQFLRTKVAMAGVGGFGGRIPGGFSGGLTEFQCLDAIVEQEAFKIQILGRRVSAAGD